MKASSLHIFTKPCIKRKPDAGLFILTILRFLSIFSFFGIFSISSISGYLSILGIFGIIYFILKKKFASPEKFH